MNKFFTHYSHKQSDELRTEAVDSKSMTVPDQSYSIRDLVAKFTSGVTAPVDRAVYYDPDGVDFDDVDFTKDGSFDFSDFSAYMAQIEAQEEVKLAADEAAKAKAKADADVKAAADAKAKADADFKAAVKAAIASAPADI